MSERERERGKDTPFADSNPFNCCDSGQGILSKRREVRKKESEKESAWKKCMNKRKGSGEGL